MNVHFEKLSILLNVVQVNGIFCWFHSQDGDEYILGGGTGEPGESGLSSWL